jgi:hypothetical protein
MPRSHELRAAELCASVPLARPHTLCIDRRSHDSNASLLQAKGRRIAKELAVPFPHPAFVNEVLVTAKIPHEYEVRMVVVACCLCSSLARSLIISFFNRTRRSLTHSVNNRDFCTWPAVARSSACRSLFHSDILKSATDGCTWRL